MLRAAICSNMPNDPEFRDLLARYGELNPGAGLQLIEFSGGLPLLEALPQQSPFDLYFIQLPLADVDGMELARQLHRWDGMSPIIFLASGPEQAMDAYRVSALQYLTRPLNADLLFNSLDLLTRLVHLREGPGVQVNTPDGLRLVTPGEIRYVECVGHVLEFHKTDRELLRSRNIRVPFTEAVAPLMRNRRFLQPHKSFVVNMDEIVCLAPEGIVLRNEKLVIPVPRSRFAEVKAAYNSYLLSEGIAVPEAPDAP